MIQTMMPFAPDQNLGGAYNQAMRTLPDDGWACFLDHDAIWTTREWYGQLAEAAAFQPEAGLFTAVGSRASRSWQSAGDPESHDMRWHRDFGHRRLATRTLLDVTNTRGIGGFVMLISKKSWSLAGGFPKGMYCVDHGIHFALARIGRPIYVIEGLYVYHWRRADGKRSPGPKVVGCPCKQVVATDVVPNKRLKLP